jgi:hypothetical protein
MDRSRTFDQWMQEVNHRIAHLCGGMTSDDLPDWNYRDAYDASAWRQGSPRDERSEPHGTTEEHGESS